MKRARILVVDDKESFLALFKRIMPRDLDIVCARDGKQALQILQQERFDVVVSDVRMPGADGLTLLRTIRDKGIDTAVVLMTAYGTIADAVHAMKYGAADYLTKPFEPAVAVAAVEHALAQRSVASTALASKEPVVHPRIVGESGVMKDVLVLVHRASTSDATVLVTGESGTGKELIAREIHERSPRSSGRFVPVNCGALPENLIESELFGHVRGAFTGAVATKRGLFEEASGGTLFLDEIGELPLPVQVKLTRALQERAVRRVGAVEEHAVDARIVAATNLDLGAAVVEGRFREDLYYRLNVLAIPLPPLRERREDIAPLTRALLARAATASRGAARRVSPQALAVLEAYDWPGNVRQLENALARAAAMTAAETLDVDALPAEVRRPASPRPPSLAALPYRDAIALERERATKDYLVALLRDVQGNVTQAAERAGIERESFHRLMKRHGVRAEDFRGK
ncbi:MAG: sigma-54-dependent Fis family transcriptional regulator [Deltaproteobacteria bacterium]|nr:sigma-54-dependent Fis family transcriptional regulator [Deltaproteobacteria bacterium]